MKILLDIRVTVTFQRTFQPSAGLSYWKIGTRQMCMKWLPIIRHVNSVEQCRTVSTVSTVSTVIARCYLHLRWYFFSTVSDRTDIRTFLVEHQHQYNDQDQYQKSDPRPPGTQHPSLIQTRQSEWVSYLVSEWVSEWVSDRGRQWSDLGPIKSKDRLMQTTKK